MVCSSEDLYTCCAQVALLCELLSLKAEDEDLLLQIVHTLQIWVGYEPVRHVLMDQPQVQHSPLSCPGDTRMHDVFAGKHCNHGGWQT